MTNQGEVTVGQANGRANAALLAETPAQDGRPGAVFRSAGDRFLLVEFGPMELDLTLNFRVLGLNQALKDAGIAGVIETIPALRSILIHYDSTELAPSRPHRGGGPALRRRCRRSRTSPFPAGRSACRWRSMTSGPAPTSPSTCSSSARTRQTSAMATISTTPRSTTGCAMPRSCRLSMATPWWNAANGFFPGLPFMFPLDPRYAVVIPKYNPTRPVDARGRRRHRRAVSGDLPGALTGRVSTIGRTIPIYDAQQRNPAFKDNPILMKPGDRVSFTRRRRRADRSCASRSTTAPTSIRSAKVN